MRVTTIARARSARTNPLLVIERILRDREGIWRQISAEESIGALMREMFITAAASLACYGAVLGLSHSALQALSSALKLPILFLLTLAICLPTLYLFNLVFGARLTVQQALALVIVAITVTSMLTLAFAPISLFFLITAPDYDFFKLLNVGVFTLTGIIGLRFLTEGMTHMNMLASGDTPAPAEPAPATADIPIPQAGAPAPAPASAPPVNTTLLRIWILVYGFVGTQLAWTLRPFFGDPNQPFALFRSIEGNFYVNMANTVLNLFR